MAAFEFDQNPFQVAQASAIHTYALTNLEIEPRLARQAGRESLPNGFDLTLCHRDRRAPDSHDLLYAGRHKKRPAIVKIEAAKQIAREQRLVDLLHPVRPAPLTLVQRKKTLEALPRQLGRNQGFAPRPYLQCKPWQSGQFHFF